MIVFIVIKIINRNAVLEDQNKKSRIIEKIVWSNQEFINNFDESEKLLFKDTLINTIKNSTTAKINEKKLEISSKKLKKKNKSVSFETNVIS